MKRRYRTRKRPVITISPINRNSSDDTLVVEKISVNSDFSQKIENPPKMMQPTYKRIKKKNFLENIQMEDIIIFGIIMMLLFKRNEPDTDEDECDEDTNKGFSLEGLRKMLPLDKLSENDILLALMIYLLF